MLLSVAIATYNEEKNIINCLSSIYDWVDEIIIVDGRSSDNTVPLIKQFDRHHKIKLFIENNPLIFHINKQKAIERCQGEWILQLDADEIVTKKLKEEILNATGGNTVAYRIPRLNFFLGKPLRKGGQYPDYTIRLYCNGVAKFPCQTVHEQVTIVSPIVIPSDPPAGGKSRDPQFNNRTVGNLKAPLLHYPYPTFEEYLNKWNRYTTLDAEILIKEGIKPSGKNFLRYFFLLPKLWFLKTYVRHQGWQDGWPGFVFSLFSAIRYWAIYVKLEELTSKTAND